MKKIYNAVFKQGQYNLLLFFSVATMCLLTFASQLEILSFGILTNKNFKTTTDDSGNLVGWITSFIDEIINVSENTASLAILLICVALFKAVTLFSHGYLTQIIAVRVERDLRERYFQKLQKMPMGFFHEFNAGILSSRLVEDAYDISCAVNSFMVNYVRTPFTLTTTLILCFATSWKLTLLVFIGFPLIILPISFIAKRVRAIATQLKQREEKFTSVLIDFVFGIQTVKMFRMEQYSFEKFSEQNNEIARLEQKSARYDLSSRPVVHTIAIIFLSISMLWGLYVLELTIPDALFFCGLLYIFYEPVKRFAEENVTIQRGVVAVNRMEQVLSMPPEVHFDEAKEDIKQFSDSIEFDRVSFRYGEEWVLRNVSFTIRKGETVALVGPTGAGKSTLVQLLPRLYDIQEGDIKIDGHSIKRYTRDSLRELMAFVPQRPFLFLDTIANNIAFGRDYSLEDIQRAAKAAHAEEFIQRLPEKYETPLLTSGKNLSGGQQQRLAIARALVKNSPLLIMDEATSALDNLSELLIKQTLHELSGEVTQLIIAHRLTTIQEADKIVYLEEGQVLGIGSKEELVASCPQFRQMWNAMEYQTK